MHGIGMPGGDAGRGLSVPAFAGIAIAVGKGIFIGNSVGGSTIVTWDGDVRREGHAPIEVLAAELIGIVRGSDRFGSVDDDRPIGDAP